MIIFHSLRSRKWSDRCIRIVLVILPTEIKVCHLTMLYSSYTLFGTVITFPPHYVWSIFQRPYRLLPSRALQMFRLQNDHLNRQRCSRVTSPAVFSFSQVLYLLAPTVYNLFHFGNANLSLCRQPIHPLIQMLGLQNDRPCRPRCSTITSLAVCNVVIKFSTVSASFLRISSTSVLAVSNLNSTYSSSGSMCAYLLFQFARPRFALACLATGCHQAFQHRCQASGLATACLSTP